VQHASKKASVQVLQIEQQKLNDGMFWKSPQTYSLLLKFFHLTQSRLMADAVVAKLVLIAYHLGSSTDTA